MGQARNIFFDYLSKICHLLLKILMRVSVRLQIWPTISLDHFEKTSQNIVKMEFEIYKYLQQLFQIFQIFDMIFLAWCSHMRIVCHCILSEIIQTP